MKNIEIIVAADGTAQISTKIIGHAGEHFATTLYVRISTEWLPKMDFYRLFFKLGGAIYLTELITATGDTVIYPVPQAAIGIAGSLRLQVVGYDSNDVDENGDYKQIDKSDNMIFTVLESITGGDLIPGVAKSSLEIAVDAAREQADISREWANTALNNILNGVNTHNDDSAAHPSIQSDIRAVEAIARGKATARVFDTHDDMAAWLAVPENVETLSIGDNLYIREIDVKDYWWDGTAPQVLEAEAPDLTDYYTKAEIDGMMPIYKTRTQYNDLYNQGLILAGRVYFINEGA